MDSVENYIKDFIFHCQYEKNLSEKTIQSYKMDLNQFLNFLEKNEYPIKLTLIDKIILKEFIKYISNKKPKTIKRKIATLKAMFNYLEYEDEILINPFRKMRIQIREPYAIPVVLTYNEILKIFKNVYQLKNIQLDRNKYSYIEIIRDIAVLELLFATGIRVSELCNLKLYNVDKNFDSILVNGKGSKERMIQICNKETKSALRDYNDLFCTKRNGGEYFFINRLNNPISDQSVRFMIKKYTTKINLQKKVTPHTFRHTFATLLLEEGVDMVYIQHLLGHSSIITTQIYTHVNRKKQKQILQSKHPRRKFEMMNI